MYFCIQTIPMKDPVSALFDSFPFDPEKVLATACGDAYVAVMLANGQIGVCSTLNKPVETDPLQLHKPDLKIFDHRVLVIAYANAHINYLDPNPVSGDIFEQVDFTAKKNTVMIGYFPPLVAKFRKDGLPLFAFDQVKDYPDLTPISQLKAKLDQSDCVIITATSLINSTFSEIVGMLKPGSEIYLLGPSTTLSSIFFEDYAISGLFGMTFKLYDFNLLEIISKGLGTQSFSKKGKKVALHR
jgi:uncharacterized protein (DUF4213/DUF364 family)